MSDEKQEKIENEGASENKEESEDKTKESDDKSDESEKSDESNASDESSTESAESDSAEKTDSSEVELGDKVVGEIELPSIDLSQYIGQKTKIQSVTEHKGIHGFYIRVSTPVVDTVELGGKQVELTASRNLSLHKNDKGEIGWGKDTILGRFLKDHNVKHYRDLVGKEVIIQLKDPNKDGKRFLTF